MDCIDCSRQTPSLNPSLIKWNVLNPKSTQCCSHCGLKGQVQQTDSICLCARCRQDYCFCYQKNKESLVYKWCFRCEVYHSVQFFWNDEFGVYDICCQKKSARRTRSAARKASVENVSEERMLVDIETSYTKQRERLTRMFLLKVRKEFRASLSGVCCVCLKEKVSSAEHGKVRYLGVRLSRYKNHHNPSRSSVVNE